MTTYSDNQAFPYTEVQACFTLRHKCDACLPFHCVRHELSKNRCSPKLCLLRPLPKCAFCRRSDHELTMFGCVSRMKFSVHDIRYARKSPKTCTTSFPAGSWGRFLNDSLDGIDLGSIQSLNLQQMVEISPHNCIHLRKIAHHSAFIHPSSSAFSTFSAMLTSAPAAREVPSLS